MVNTRQSCLGTIGDERQLSIIFLRETPPQIGHLLPNQIGIIEQPLRRKGEGVMHFGRHRETCVRPFQRALYFSQSPQKGLPAWLRIPADQDRTSEVCGVFRETLNRRSLLPKPSRGRFAGEGWRRMKSECHGRLG